MCVSDPENTPETVKKKYPYPGNEAFSEAFTKTTAFVSKRIEPLHAFFMGVPKRSRRTARMCPFLGYDQGDVSHAVIPNSALIHTGF